MQSEKIKQEEPVTVQNMFNSIAPRYDLLNRLISFGMDKFWRKKAIEKIKEKRGGKILDIAAGSGDLTLEATSIDPELIVASDFAVNMYDFFKKKVERLNKNCTISFVLCDALSLPFASGTFDVVMVAFGIRNFSDRIRSLREMNRVLKPDGMVLILELTYPTNPVVKQMYTLHTKFFLPLIGRIISGHKIAYSYLPHSIESFPDNENFTQIMMDAGFKEVEFQKLTFGTATIFTGRKPSNPE